jgi:hypothetical protein
MALQLNLSNIKGNMASGFTSTKTPVQRITKDRKANFDRSSTIKNIALDLMAILSILLVQIIQSCAWGVNNWVQQRNGGNSSPQNDR